MCRLYHPALVQAFAEMMVEIKMIVMFRHLFKIFCKINQKLGIVYIDGN